MKKIQYRENYNDLDQGVNQVLKTNIDTFKSYETIEFEKEDEDYLKVKDWDIMINNFGLIKQEVYACKDASTKSKEQRIKYLFEN